MQDRLAIHKTLCFNRKRRTQEERGAKGGYVFADNTLIDTRIVGVYFDTSVPQPAMQAIFVDSWAIRFSVKPIIRGSHKKLLLGLASCSLFSVLY